MSGRTDVESATRLYQLPMNSAIEVFIATTEDSRRLLTTPECIGTLFQDGLSRAIQSTVKALITCGESKLGSIVAKYPSDVLYVLRGGLNFDLHRILASTLGYNPEVSFLSSQRTLVASTPQITETGYSTWSLQRNSILWLGDISATGATACRALNAAISRYEQIGSSPTWVVLITIGTRDSLQKLTNEFSRITDSGRVRVVGMTVVFLEGVFALFKGSSALDRIHLPYTDFFRKASYCAPEFERASLSNPVSLFERCVVYDGGSRAFEPGAYSRNLRQYWKSLAESDSTVTAETVLAMKSNLLDYRKAYAEWAVSEAATMCVDDDCRMQLYELGVSALAGDSMTDLRSICEKRLTMLQETLPKAEGVTMPQVIDKLAWIHIENRKILSTLSRGKDTYYIPGGKREENETDDEALIREIREELSIELIPESLRFVGRFEAQAHGKTDGIVVRMTCYTGEFSGRITPSSEVEQAVWFTHKDREKSSAVDKIIFDWLKDKNLID